MLNFHDGRPESIYSGDEIELLMTNEKINSTYESSGIDESSFGSDYGDFTFDLEQLAFDLENNEELNNKSKWFLVPSHNKINIILFIIFMTVGIPLNILILVVAASNRNSAPSSSFLVVNMAVCDLIVLMNSWIFIKKYFELGSWKWVLKFPVLLQRLMCKVTYGILPICFFASVA